MNNDPFDYPVPITIELKQLDLLPYRTNSSLHRKIDYIFRHIYNPHSKQFIDISTSGSRQLVQDMSIRAVAMTRHFLDNPQQYGHSMDNIHLQIVVRMWRQMFKHKILQGYKLPDEYMPAKMKLLSIENGLLEELIRTVEEKDFIQSSDDMVKVRKGVNIRDRKYGYSEKNLNYYDNLDD